jgi:hypothetical protein
MMKRRGVHVSLLVLVGVALTLFVQCKTPSTIGNYAVTGTLQTNTCGAGLAPPSPWNFSVQLSQEDSTLYWNTLDGSPLKYGDIVGATASLTGGTDGVVDTGPDGSAGPCSMSRTDVIDLTLTGSPPTAFTGTLTYTFDVDSGSDCSDQSGTYDTLPCSISYVVSGTK